MLLTAAIGLAPGSPVTGVSGAMVTAFWDCSFKDVPSDAGYGTLNISESDPQLGDIALGKYLRLYVDGVHRFTFRVERKSPNDVDSNEESGQLTKVEGRTLVSEWDDATVQPENGMEKKPYSTTRIFGFANPYFDDSSWSTAFEQFQQDETDGPPTGLYGLPEDYPDPFSQWVWSQAYTGTDIAPATSYFRDTFTLVTPGNFRIVFAADNKFKLYIDGIEIASMLDNSNEGWMKLFDTDVAMTAGDHVIAAVVENIAGASNFAGLINDIYYVDGVAGLGTNVVTSDNTWLMLHDPGSAPGFTIDAVVQILLDEAQALGFLTGWSIVTHGSFSELAEIPVGVGQSLMTVLKQFAEAYIDFDTAIAAKELHLWPKGDRSTASGVAFALGDNVLALAHDQQDTVKNAAHVLYKLGHVLIEDTATRSGFTSIQTYGRREAFLSLEDFETLDAVNEYLTGWFEVNAWPRYAVTLGVDPTTGDVPYANFTKTDTVVADGETLGVASIAAKADEVGDAVWTLEVSSRAELIERRLDNQLKAKSVGTVGGRVLTASPTKPGVSGGDRLLQPSTKRIQSYSWAGDVTVALSGFPPLDRPVRLTGVIVTSHGDGSGSTVMHLNVNGVSAGSVTMGASDTSVRASFVADLVAGDVLEADCTTAGGHTGVVVTPRVYYV